MAAYVKLVPLAVFLLATSLMFPMKKVEAQACNGPCSPFQTTPCGSSSCRCFPVGPLAIAGFCYDPTSVRIMKMVEEHPNLCQSHDDCMKKGSGSFCARYPNPDIEYGWCFVSNTEAEGFFKNIGSNSEAAKGFLKMPAAAIAN